MFHSPSGYFYWCDLVASDTDGIAFLSLQFPVLEMPYNGHSFVLFYVLLEFHFLNLALVLTYTIWPISNCEVTLSNYWRLRIFSYIIK